MFDLIIAKYSITDNTKDETTLSLADKYEMNSIQWGDSQVTTVTCKAKVVWETGLSKLALLLASKLIYKHV